MKNMIITILSFLISSSAYAQDAVMTTDAKTNNGRITIEITGLDSDEGQLMVAVYDSASNWLKNIKLGKISPIKDGQATVIIESIPYGTYGISTFHDENSNGELDAGLFGIPKEPYASSRGAKGMFGPPKWGDAIFEVNAAEVTELIKY